MEVNEVKKIIDTYRVAGRSREDTVEIVGNLPINGETVECYEYINLVYKEAQDFIDKYFFTDAENAEYLTSIYGNILRFDHRRSQWLEWRTTGARTQTVKSQGWP